MKVMIVEPMWDISESRAKIGIWERTKNEETFIGYTLSDTDINGAFYVIGTNDMITYTVSESMDESNSDKKATMYIALHLSYGDIPIPMNRKTYLVLYRSIVSTGAGDILLGSKSGIQVMRSDEWDAACNLATVITPLINAGVAEFERRTMFLPEVVLSKIRDPKELYTYRFHESAVTGNRHAVYLDRGGHVEGIILSRKSIPAITKGTAYPKFIADSILVARHEFSKVNKVYESGEVYRIIANEVEFPEKLEEH